MGHTGEVGMGEGRADALRYDKRLLCRHLPRGLHPPAAREVLPLQRLENKVRVLAVFSRIVGRRNVRVSPQPRRRPRFDEDGPRRIRSADDQQHGALENRIACLIQASRRNRGDLANVGCDSVSIRSCESTRLELHQGPRCFNNNHQENDKDKKRGLQGKSRGRGEPATDVGRQQR